MKKQNPVSNVTDTINHVVFVIDASDSMKGISSEVVKVTDGLVADLADLSKQLDQETRVTVYLFSDSTWCLFYEKDVLRLPSIAAHYQTVNMTALIDATIQATEELRQTATLHGNHAFLTYVITDGQENVSTRTMYDLQQLLGNLRDNETLACLVPSQSAKFTAEKYGFPRGNIQVWDASSAQGMREAGDTIRTSTANYMGARAQGMTNTRTLFSMDANTLNHKTVSTLKELTGFRIETVKQPSVIKPFIESLGLPFIQGNYFFQLIKPEKVSDAKQILVRHKISGKVYGGPEARRLVGLPDTGEVRVKPQPNGEYDVFIQSSSLNRNLIAGHDLLIKV
ncbi:MAG TPA: vWA domain-containing protein [Gemmatimonadales bacterium]|nr:vWA domain-containing protein [Gemmatimonadales bacterium]